MFMAQLIGTTMGVLGLLWRGMIVCEIIGNILGIRLSEEQEFNGVDLSIHRTKRTLKSKQERALLGSAQLFLREKECCK